MGGAITNISATPIIKIKLSISYTDESISDYILETGKVYNIEYIDMQLTGDSPSDSRQKKICGKLIKISKLNHKNLFVPFYSGDVYILEFDCSDEYESKVVRVTTPQIRFLEEYIPPVIDDSVSGGVDPE